MYKKKKNPEHNMHLSNLFFLHSLVKKASYCDSLLTSNHMYMQRTFKTIHFFWNPTKQFVSVLNISTKVVPIISIKVSQKLSFKLMRLCVCFFTAILSLHLIILTKTNVIFTQTSYNCLLLTMTQES